MRKAQTLSMDLMVGVMVFIGMLILFFGLIMFSPNSSGVEELNNEGEHILKTLESDTPNLGFINKNQIQEGELNQLITKEYDDLKSEMGIRNDFCIFLEDENGNVVPIVINDERYFGIGKDNVKVGGVGCGKLEP